MAFSESDSWARETPEPQQTNANATRVAKSAVRKIQKGGLTEITLDLSPLNASSRPRRRMRAKRNECFSHSIWSGFQRNILNACLRHKTELRASCRTKREHRQHR